MATILMTGEELARRHLDVARNHKTIYGYAMYGWQITDKTIATKKAQNLNGWYTAEHVNTLKAVANQSPPVWGFDCVNLTKGILWGWTGDESKTYGGATHAAKGVPDTNANGMINRCKEVSSDFSHIEIGEGLWLEGHWGMYVGNGLAVECTGRWENGVQITAVHNLGKKSGYNGRYWTKHGKLPWIAYSGEADTVEPEIINLGDRTIRKGTQGTDVKELQELLLKAGYALPKFGADGDCGTETVTAIKLFQTNQGLEVDGEAGTNTIAALRAMTETSSGADAPPSPEGKAAPANPAELLTVILYDVGPADAETLLKHWRGEIAKG